MEPGFDWDPAKERRNKRLHGIPFESAPRCVAIGMTRGLVMLVVVFVVRYQHDAGVIRIISARRAVAYEESIYQDQIT